MTRRGGDGKFETVPATLPLLFRKAPTKRSIAVAKGNRTRASKWRRECLAKFGVVLP